MSRAPQPVAGENPVWVTGGGGFVGSHLVRRLLAGAARVTLLTSANFASRRLGDDLSRVNVHPVADVEDLLRRERPEVVYHLASTPFQPPGRPAREHAGVIIGGTLALLEGLRAAPPKRFVFAGSAAEYGDGSQLRESSRCAPATVLGAMKLAASALVQSYGRMLGMETVIARLFTPFGPWEDPSRLVPFTIGAAMRGSPVKLNGDGSQQRDFVYVEDAADALARMGYGSLDGETIFNVSLGRGVSVREMAGRVLSLMQSRVPIECVGGAGRPDEIRECSGDSTLARQVLGWKPRDVEEGLRQTIRWFEGNSQWLQQQKN